MKNKEVLIIFALAVLVTKLSVASPFSGLMVFQLPSKLVRRSLFQFLILTGVPLFEGPYWYEMLIFLSLFFLQFLFWFLVLAVGWWVKMDKNKK